MAADPSDFDLAAAWTRRAGTDRRAFAEALAARLVPALPGRVTVERKRDGFFSAASHVARIAIRFDDVQLTIADDGAALRASRAKVVRGVTIGSEDLAIPAWLDELVRRTRALGADAEAGQDGLHDFLTS